MRRKSIIHNPDPQVSKSTIIIGIIMLAAAAMFYYFDDSLALRIIAGVMFVTGSVMLYYSITTGSGDEEDDSAEPAATDEETPLYSYDDGTSTAAGAPHTGVPHTGAPHTGAPQAGSPHSGPKSPLADPNLMSATAEQHQEDATLATEDAPVFTDPKEEFDYLTGKLLAVLKEHLIAHSVGLFWINPERGQIVLGECVTDSKNFTTAKRINLGADFISRVGAQGVPELISEINPASEMDLLPYYVDTEGVQSFVGVPLFFMGNCIAVVAADSKAPDAFGRETVVAVNHFVAIIVSLLQSYNQKFDLMADSKMLGILNDMQLYIETHYDPYGIASAATRAVTEAMDWDHAALVLNNPEKHGWTVVKVHTKSSQLLYVTEGSAVDLERSALRSVIDDMEGKIMNAPKMPAFRFHEKENIDSRGQLCAVPLATPHKCYGLLSVEYREAAQYAQKDIATLERIATHAATALEIVALREMTGKHLLVDEIAHVPSRGYLGYRLAEETARISELGGQGVYVVVAVDKPADLVVRHGDTVMDIVMYHLGKMLPEYVKPYDFMGRAGADGFGLFMTGSGAEESYLRAEKLRKAVTSHTIPYGGISFSVTVSVAGCVVHQGMDADAVLRLAQQVLDRAIADGGNTTKIV